MPTVDINAPRQMTSNKENGAFNTGLPMPVLLAIVGGGIGLVVFLTRKAGANQQTDTNAANGTLLPNTAIMLGSLQQGVLETEGKVTQGNADLSSQLTGVGENLGAQIDAQSGQIANSFADLSTFLNNSSATIQGQQDALASAISTLGTQNSGLASSLSTVLKNLGDINTGINQNRIGINNTYSSLLATQNQLSTQLNSLGNQVTGVSGQVSGVSGQLTNQNRQATLPVVQQPASSGIADGTWVGLRQDLYGYTGVYGVWSAGHVVEKSWADYVHAGTPHTLDLSKENFYKNVA